MAADYSYGAAIGLFNSVVNISFLLVTNRISRKVTDTPFVGQINAE